MLEKIEKLRYQNQYNWDDLKIGVDDKTDLMGVSEAFWNFLVDFYGVDFVIEIHKHSIYTNTEPVYKDGEKYLSFQMHPNLCAAALLILNKPLEQRLRLEQDLSESIQNDPIWG